MSLQGLLNTNLGVDVSFQYATAVDAKSGKPGQGVMSARATKEFALDDKTIVIAKADFDLSDLNNVKPVVSVEVKRKI
eukprot:tig00000828_g4626.t1